MTFYTKYRPQTWGELAGQMHVTQTLMNALKNDNVAHALLFAGKHGTGKTTVARILARELGAVGSDLVEIDAASNRGIDDARRLKESTYFVPINGPVKVFIVDECFRYSDIVSLSNESKMPIGQLVEKKLYVDVLSWNEEKNCIEAKPIVGHIKKKPSQRMMVIRFDNNREVVCTENHRFYTPSGLKYANELNVKDFVCANYERVTKHQLDVIIGCSLGDGNLSLTHSQMRARLCLTHGAKQEEYLNYKVGLLGDLIVSKPYYGLYEKSFSKVGTYSVSTLSRPQIALLYRELYGENGKKLISREYLDKVTLLGLALWYLDDGSLSISHQRYKKKDGTISEYVRRGSVLHMQGFEMSDAVTVAEWLKDKWDIHVKIQQGPVVNFTKSGTILLHKLIAEYVPPCMDYKLLDEYKGLFKPLCDNRELAGIATSIVRDIGIVSSPEFVYNIEVADNHNYFVRDILVANCHMLTKEANNALLKTLEEPPPGVYFILCTTNPQKLIPTILSRCQRHNFKSIAPDVIVMQLEKICTSERLGYDHQALDLIARQANGSMRDAISMLDLFATYGYIMVEKVKEALGLADRKLIEKMLDGLADEDIQKCLETVSELWGSGLALDVYCGQMTEYLRALLLMELDQPDPIYSIDKSFLGRFKTVGLRYAVGVWNQARLDVHKCIIPSLELECAAIDCLDYGISAEAGDF